MTLRIGRDIEGEEETLLVYCAWATQEGSGKGLLVVLPSRRLEDIHPGLLTAIASAMREFKEGLPRPRDLVKFAPLTVDRTPWPR